MITFFNEIAVIMTAMTITLIIEQVAIILSQKIRNKRNSIK